MQLEKLDGIAIGKLVNSGELSPVEVIEYFIKRIETRNPSINAFTYTKFEQALDEAKKLEVELIKQNVLCNKPFAGVPVALKDFLDSKLGWTNSHGGVKPLVREDQCDSEFTKAAETLGAICIGKTNAPAFGFSGACHNAMYGSTRNPFDTTRTSGGSSGGTAAAVADGLIGFGEGGDAGGSIRIPSGWCNLFGFKPSLGTVPSYCRPDGWSATHPYCFNGCLTKSVRDSATMLMQMAQYNPYDPISLPINSNKDFIKLMNKPIKGMKIAFTDDFNLYPVNKEVQNIIRKSASKLVQAGAVIEFVTFNWKHSLEEILDCWSWTISIDTALDLYYWKQAGLDLVSEYSEYLPEEFIKFNDKASQMSIFDFRKFNEIRTDILDNFQTILDKYDAIISPTAVCEPLKIDENGQCVTENIILDPEYSFISFGETPLVNFIGYPACSIPAGFTNNNLPIGMQIIGKQYHDEDVLAIAKTFEEIQPWDYELALSRGI